MKKYDAWEVFKDNPWESIPKNTYPSGRLLYQRDDRYWVSVNKLGQWVFYIHTVCTGICDININVPSINLELEDYKRGEKRLVCTLLDLSEDLTSKFVVVAKYIAVETAKYHGMALFNDVLKTIQGWSEFLKPKGGALTHSELIGFWGECYVVSHMMPTHQIEDVMRYWVGPEGAKKDITFNTMALEVKTTAASGAREISISSLDQLDQTTDKLYLILLQLNPSQENIGMTLHNLYTDLRKKSSVNFSTLALFMRKTQEMIDRASKEQLSEHFLLSDFSIYDICKDFPKITRENVPEGVIDARYRLTISSLQPFDVTHESEGIIENG